MSLLYLDTFSGISGDMFLGLLVDLGLSPEDLEADLRLLPLSGWRLDIRRESRMGIEGTRVEVVCEEGHHHRTWADIDAMLRESALAPDVKDLSRRIFLRIGQAEAKVHGVPLETVHFHEVGALDSIVDVVGAAIGIVRLGLRRIVASPLPLSRGMVQTAHGNFPLPAPATVEILRGAPVTDAGSQKELVTPTGAAIAAEAATFGPLPSMTLSAVGYGVGGWNLPDRPNLLRGIVGQEETDSLESDRVSVLETHLDDANPEWLGALMENLLGDGALDVAYAPLQMKKNRPGTRLTVIAPLPLADALARRILRESSAIGVRMHETRRLKLRREEAIVATPWGDAKVKRLYEGKQLVRVTPEYESCRDIACKHGIPLPQVYRAVERAADEIFGV
jgi:pyridinium-3,5-bisthiocarboxylic acid mononucleotide nickel chelatase